MPYRKGYSGAGPLQMRVEIQAFTLQPDDGGGHVKSWATVKTLWANVKPLSGFEVTIGQQPQSEVSHKICIRYLANGFDTGWRVKWGDRYFSVQSVVDLHEGQRYMELRAKERAQKFFES